MLARSIARFHVVFFRVDRRGSSVSGTRDLENLQGSCRFSTKKEYCGSLFEIVKMVEVACYSDEGIHRPFGDFEISRELT